VTDVLTPHQTALEMLGHSQAVLGDVRQLHGELCELLERAQEPGMLTTVSLSSARLARSYSSQVDAPTRSVALFNPTAVQVYLGEAVPVPPKSGLVLPIAASEFEVGIDPSDATSIAALGTSTAVVFLIRFKAVQPFFFGAWSG
jgi:hypothetical protein